MLDHIIKNDINILLQRLDPNIFKGKRVLITVERAIGFYSTAAQEKSRSLSR